MAGELPPVRRIERALAKRHVLGRLRVVYPHLRGNPAALEEAYNELDLELAEIETDTGVLIYEMRTPRGGNHGRADAGAGGS